MRTRSRLLATVAAAGLLLAACGEEGATEEGLIRSLTDASNGNAAPVTTEQARCITDTLFGQYDEDQLDAIARADSLEEMPPGAAEAVDQAIDTCVEPDRG